MKVYKHLEQLPNFSNTVITIGTFDGVHLGHQTIIKHLTDTAKRKHAESVLITFEPHPRLVLSSYTATIDLLTTLDEKIALLSAYDIDHLVIVPFTTEFAMLTAQQYISDFLVRYFKPATIIIGYDHHFGIHRSGNIFLLKENEQKYHYKVIEIEAKLIDENNVSSTYVRQAVKQGKLQEAEKLLGRHYALQGKVIHGQKLGRTIGFPTANILVEDKYKLIPSNGVYAVTCILNQAVLKGMMNIGTRPTVDQSKTINVEVHLFDFDKDIYNCSIDIHFIAYIRKEQRFENVAELKKQLEEDKHKSLHILKI